MAPSQKAHASTATRINPTTDLEYLGAFRVPTESSGGTSWSYGGEGLGYWPNGDPTGPSDGFTGSLFGIGHGDVNYVSEITIPVPVISPTKNLSDLNRATTLQPFTDVSNGRMYSYVQVNDVQYLPAQGAQTTDKLYWSMYDYYVPAEEKLLGWSELDFTNLNSTGAWKLTVPSLNSTAAQVRHLLEIPQGWADVYTPGKYLAASRRRPGQSGGSYAPSLYAIAPWNDGNPPPDGAALSTVQLMYYPSAAYAPPGAGSTHEFADGAWLAVGSKQALIFAGTKTVGSYDNGLEYYGSPHPHFGEGSKGQHADPNFASILFYDPDDLAAVAQGTMEPYEPQPYAQINLQQYMFNDNPSAVDALGGVAYDRDHQLLYVMEKKVDANKPIVHVWSVADNGVSALDTTPPIPPEGLQLDSVSSSSVQISWSASTDNVGVGGYVVYRNGIPVDMTDGTTLTDTSVSPAITYNYSVVAFDLIDNRSPQTTPLAVTTGSGTDSKVPDIRNRTVRDIASSSAVVTWTTDEPATTTLKWWPLYHTELTQFSTGVVLETSHSVALSGLTANQRYDMVFISDDASGNRFQWTNSYTGGHFYTAYAPPGGNTAPVLSAIGSQTITTGEKVAFTLSASDPEGKRTSFQADNVPEGATFNRTKLEQEDKGYFEWTPRMDQAGTYNVTFTVSDGALTDSEVVTITVQGNPALYSTTPADNATGVSATTNLTITFNENVIPVTGNVTIKRASDNATIEAIDVTDTTKVSGSGTSTITVNPSTTLDYSTAYYVQIDATAFDDASGNSYAGISDTTSWSFTTAAFDGTAPSIFSLSPADNATGVSTTANLVINFDEAIGMTGTGYVRIYKSSDNSVVEQINTATGAVTGSGTATISINPTVTLDEATAYYIKIDNMAFPDAAGNFFVGISSATTWNFTTADTTNPTLSSLTPADNAIGVSVGSDLTLNFSEAVDPETGNITIPAVRIESQLCGKLVLVKTSRERLNGRFQEGPIRKESPRWQVILPWKNVKS